MTTMQASTSKPSSARLPVVALSVAVALLGTGCIGKTRTPGIVVGGMVAGLGVVGVAASTGGSCSSQDPGSNVGCGMHSAGNAMVFGTIAAVGVAIIAINALRGAAPPAAVQIDASASVKAPVAAQSFTLQMR